MTIEIRTIDRDEASDWLFALSTSFQEHWDTERFAEQALPLWDLERVWAAVEAGVIVGTLRTFASELTLPGTGRLPATAVAAVSVRGTHRRRGILRRLMAAEHAAARERGEPVAVLHASEYPIYGHFGYGPASLEATWTVDTSAMGPLAGAPQGVELVRPALDTTRDALVSVFERWRSRQVGEVMRREVTWDWALGRREPAYGTPWKGFVALHRGADGEVDGYARYHVDEHWADRQPRNKMVVDELHALADGAYDALVAFLLSMDLTGSVRLVRRRLDERLPWLLANARAAIVSDVGDDLWVRIDDVPRVLEARRYERDGAVVLEVVGDDEARTRVLLETSVDGARCEVTDRAPDLTLPLAALGAACLGGTRLRDAIARSGADEHTRGALANAGSLLRTAEAPWCSTMF